MAPTRAGSCSLVSAVISGLGPAPPSQGKSFPYIQTGTCGHCPLCPVPLACPSSGQPLGAEQAGGDESQAAWRCLARYSLIIFRLCVKFDCAPASQCGGEVAALSPQFSMERNTAGQTLCSLAFPLKPPGTLHLPCLQSWQGSLGCGRVAHVPGASEPRRCWTRGPDSTWGAVCCRFNGLIGKLPGRHAALTFR